MNKGHSDLLSIARKHTLENEQATPSLNDTDELLANHKTVHEAEPEITSRIDPPPTMVLSDFHSPRPSLANSVLRWAFRLGVPSQFLSSPLRKPEKLRLLGTVESPLTGNRMAGIALRAGYFLVGGMKSPVSTLDFASSSSTLAPPVIRAVHGFTWMRDLAACASRAQCTDIAGEVFSAWFAANPQAGKGPAWTVELAGLRLLNWLIHAPIVLSGEGEWLKPKMLEAIHVTTRWLDRNIGDANGRLAQAAGWSGIIAAGLLLPDGKARLHYGEAGLRHNLGEMIGADGGVLSRSPTVQAETIALLCEVRACYAAMGRNAPAAFDTILALLVPALLNLRMGDGGLGSWQGSAAMREDPLDALITASGVRSRPMAEADQWGYQRVKAQKTILVMDAAPPPGPRHALHACASALAFELSHGTGRMIVNCGGAELAGTLVPAQIEQGLRGTSAHSTLVLEDTNSTAILLHGQIGKGVEEVDFSRCRMVQGAHGATKLEASHNGYAARFGLIHRRTLLLSDDGMQLYGEDTLEPVSQKGKHDKIGFALRFHLGHGVEAELINGKRGVHLVLPAFPNASYWQFRLGGDSGDTQCNIEDSLWVDGQGRPHATKQIVVEGMTTRSGGCFPWLFKHIG